MLDSNGLEEFTAIQTFSVYEVGTGVIIVLRKLNFDLISILGLISCKKQKLVFTRYR